MRIPIELKRERERERDMANMYCLECDEEFGPGTTFCPKCRKMLRPKKAATKIGIQRETEKKMDIDVINKKNAVRATNNIDKEEYPKRGIETIGGKIIVSVSKYNIKMEIYETTVGNKKMIVYERAILPSEVDYNLFILRYIVNNDTNCLNGTTYPFPNVGKYITFVDIDDNRLRVISELDKTTWNTLRIFGMECFMDRYRPMPFDPVTRAKGDRIRFYVDPTDISHIIVKIIKICRN